MLFRNFEIVVVGLGYVGLPLAVAFGRKFKTLGCDTDERRIQALLQREDTTLEVSADDILSSESLELSTRIIPRSYDLNRIFVVTVPTPVDKSKNPDLTALKSASQAVATDIQKGDVVVYESTVYPGCTEEICVPILSEISQLEYGRDFTCGYSPERINPGDMQHRLSTVIKVVAGSDKATQDILFDLYSMVVEAGIHVAPSIIVAEAAKVIENTQRDLNIALINELACIFDKLDIPTDEVLEAAGTKWNFLPFRPGLVGGHCIGVDPYYLTHKAQHIGYEPEVILAGRRVNDGMGVFVAQKCLKKIVANKGTTFESSVLVMGFTFKENCPDIRNTKAVDVVKNLQEYGVTVDVFDPWVDPDLTKNEFGVSAINKLPNRQYDAVIICVAHTIFSDLGLETIRACCKKDGFIFDLKYVLPKASDVIRL